MAPLVVLLACTADEPTPGGSPGDSGTPVATVPRAERVVIAVLDGARYAETFGLEATPASELPGRELFGAFTGPMLSRGTLATGAVATGYTLTAPGHADIVTGTRNQFALMAAAAGSAYYRPEYPTLFEAVEAARPGTSTQLVANTMHVDALFASVYPGSTDSSGATLTTTNSEADSSDGTVTTAIRALLEASDTPLVVANLHDIDRSGHSTTNPDAYAHGLDEASTDLAALWSWILSGESGLATDTLLFVVADHGRHDWGEGEAEQGWDYSSHGDQCVGCRDIPIFAIGPGVKQGAEIAVLATLDDVGVTAAAALGVPLPHATGRVITELFETEPTVSPAGPGWLSRSGDHVATANARGLPEHRFRVELDGNVMGEALFTAEDPTSLAVGSEVVTCWRELLAQPTDANWSYRPACARTDGSSVTPLTTIPREVAPTWRAQLADGPEATVLAAWADNPDGLVEAAGFAEVEVALWDPALDWDARVIGRQAAIFPGHPSVAALGDRVFATWASSDAGEGDDGQTTLNPARYTRHVKVAALGESADAPWTPLWRSYTEACAAEAECPAAEPTLDDGGNAWGRMEFPALTASSAGLTVAWVSWGQAGVTVHVSHSAPPFDAWSTPTRVDEGGRVLGHVEPLWHEDRLYFARLGSEDTVEVCGWTAPGPAACVDTGATAARDLGAGGGVLTVLAWDGSAWAAVDYPAP